MVDDNFRKFIVKLVKLAFALILVVIPIEVITYFEWHETMSENGKIALIVLLIGILLFVAIKLDPDKKENSKN